MRPRLALVPGEPAGIGPELVVRALRHDFDADITVFGDASALQRAATALGLPLELHHAGDSRGSPRSARIVEIGSPLSQFVVDLLRFPGVLGLAGAVAGTARRGPQATGHPAPGDPARAGTVRRRSDHDEPEPGDDRDPAGGLREDSAVWGGDGARPAADDHVPLVRPDDDPDDMAGWDDFSDAEWLTGPPADNGREA